MDYHRTPETMEPTVVKIRQSGLFSAADGLFLASFLAVTIIVAYVVRVVCRRYCGDRCYACAHKRDPNAEEIPQIAIQIEAPPPTTSQPGRHVPAYSSSDLPNYNEILRQDRAKQQGYTNPGKLRKAPANPRGMQTLYEEDEMSSGSSSSLSSLGSHTSSEKMLPCNAKFYSVRDDRNIHSLPYSCSNDMLERGNVAAVHSSASLNSYQVSFSEDLDGEQPPSYEELYPKEAGLNIPESA